MALLTTGNAIEALLDQVWTTLDDDSTLNDTVTGVYTHVPEAARTNYPYVVVQAPMAHSGAFPVMGVHAERITFGVDAWSDASTPHEIRLIMARIKVLLFREDLTLTNHTMVGGSLVTVEDRDFDEPDPEQPERRLYHGHHTWICDVEES